MLKIFIVLVVQYLFHRYFLLKKNTKVTHIFSAKILVYMPIFNDQSFNNTLANDIVGFEQLGPGFVQ